jgi:thiol:disulfide interchange protein DsbD
VGAGGLGDAAARAQGLQRSVFDGVLAVLLATPCSAPFLGTAVAFALQRPAPFIFSIFTAIGLGLAAPYALLVAVPGGLRWVPRPGRWMLHLKTALGFGLLYTAVWLVWVLGRMTGVDGMARLLAVLVGMACAAWAFGPIAAAWPQRSVLHFGMLLLLSGAGAYGGLRGVLGPNGTRPDTASTADAGARTLDTWQVYSAQAVHSALADRRPVLVDFTADWCLTCQYNERHVLGDATIQAEMARKHVVLLRADYTRRDAAIQQTLAQFGRAGVPMYLLFSPERPDAPQLLPELLSVGQLADALSSLP